MIVKPGSGHATRDFGAGTNVAESFQGDKVTDRDRWDRRDHGVRCIFL